ncbi:MAG TPA: TAXI family TRAP transporter solute-binding subunit [Rhizomicrobium sp.]|nr:TAXI family TRAP transporter solute-binding subunit [Rhizomicrobium sp.]
MPTLLGSLPAVLVGTALALVGALSSNAEVQRIPFVIATGPTGGTYFPVGEAIAGIISHPPGVYRCERAGVCGPSGLIASARSSPGAVFNVLAANAHTVDAALAQSDVIREAVKGQGTFRLAGPQKHIRAVAALFPEDVHIVAAKTAHIRSVAELRGKRVGVGPDTSGTIVTARAVLSAYRLPIRRIRINNDSSDIAAEKLAQGKLDAMFFVGGAPVPLVRSLLANGSASLVPIDGAKRERLLKLAKGLKADSIPAGVYPRTGKIETVAVQSIWIVNDSVADSAVYSILKALFNPANRAALAGSHRSAQFIRLNSATVDLPAPMHAGARRFYTELGRLPKKSAAK